MTLKKIYGYGFAGIVAATIALSCTKTFDDRTVKQTDFTNSSLVQVYIGTVSATRNYVYVDGKPVNGAALSLGSVFPSAYAFNVAGGLRSFLIKDTLTATTQTPLSFPTNMQVGKNYTIFTYDTINATKQITVPTEIVIPTDNTSRIRFANIIFSKNAVPAVDIYSVKKKANIFTNVAVAQVTDFVSHVAGVTDTFYVRPTGSPTNLVNKGVTPLRAIFTPTKQRSYTLVFRGRYQTDSTATIMRTLSVMTNR